jgi:hypothetical protein
MKEKETTRVPEIIHILNILINKMVIIPKQALYPNEGKSREI